MDPGDHVNEFVKKCASKAISSKGIKLGKRCTLLRWYPEITFSQVVGQSAVNFLHRTFLKISTAATISVKVWIKDIKSKTNEYSRLYK